MDYDDDGNILGAELVGISGFGLQSFNAPSIGGLAAAALGEKVAGECV